MDEHDLASPGRVSTRVTCRPSMPGTGAGRPRRPSPPPNEFTGDFTSTVSQLDARHTRIRAGRPQTNGNVEALHRTILDECWRPAFARCLFPCLSGLRHELETYLAYYNCDRVHDGRLTRSRIPADIIYGARKMEAG